jgi:hypothetical protein
MEISWFYILWRYFNVNNCDTLSYFRDIHPSCLIFYAPPLGDPGQEAGTAAGAEGSIAAVQLQKIQRFRDATQTQVTPETTRKCVT